MRFSLLSCLFGAFGLMTPAHAIFKCQAADGSVLFTDQPCPRGHSAEALALDTRDYGPGQGLRPGERALLEDMATAQRETRAGRAERARTSHIEQTRYSRQLRLRELNMQRGEVDRRLGHGGLSPAQSSVLREQIRAIENERTQLQQLE